MISIVNREQRRSLKKSLCFRIGRFLWLFLAKIIYSRSLFPGQMKPKTNVWSVLLLDGIREQHLIGTG